MEKVIVFAALLGCSFAGVVQQTGYGHAQALAGPAVYAQYGQAVAGGYDGYAEQGQGHGGAAVAYAQPAPAAYQQDYQQQDYLKASAPQPYSKGVPAAAIRNVEQVDVTKTITPVVTKQTTHQTHSEPALAVGHVRGYTQTLHGAPQYAPVQYNTQYTTYSNPTVGVNGPVTYAGPALSQEIGLGVGVQAVAAGPAAYGQYSQYAGAGAGGHYQVEAAPVVAPPVAYAEQHAPQYAAAPVADYGHAYAAAPIADYGHAYAAAAPAPVAVAAHAQYEQYQGHGGGHGQEGGYLGGGAVIAHTDYNTYAHTLGFKK